MPGPNAVLPRDRKRTARIPYPQYCHSFDLPRDAMCAKSTDACAQREDLSPVVDLTEGSLPFGLVQAGA